MIKLSSIAENHFYYVAFFKSSVVSSPEDILKLLKAEGTSRRLQLESLVGGLTVFHIQLEIPTLYGSNDLLFMNSVERQGARYYLYDFYLGHFSMENSSYFFFCHPYKHLERGFLQKEFDRLFPDIIFYRPDVPVIMDYMFERENGTLPSKSKPNFEKIMTTEILKYSASILGEGSKAERVSIIGRNPLSSNFYRRIKELCNDAEEKIRLMPSSLKMKCASINNELLRMELLFDLDGNYRFWIKRGKMKETLSMLAPAFSLFFELRATTTSKYFPTKTKLENEN